MPDETYLIFLSHKAEVKKQIQTLKEGLEKYGVEAFVAHSDIDPGTEWQEDILEALESMDAFVPVLTKGFNDSKWTDQEVGYAIAREIQIVPLRMGMDPYGFMGKIQALSCAWEDAPKEIIKVLARDSNFVDAFVETVSECPDFVTANRLAEVLPAIDELTLEQTTGLVKAFNSNPQVRESFGFNGSWPAKHGPGLVSHLNELTGRQFQLRKNWQGLSYIEIPFWNQIAPGRVWIT